jgi:hypothetical protein
VRRGARSILSKCIRARFLGVFFISFGVALPLMLLLSRATRGSAFLGVRSLFWVTTCSTTLALVCASAFRLYDSVNASKEMSREDGHKHRYRTMRLIGACIAVLVLLAVWIAFNGFRWTVGCVVLGAISLGLAQHLRRKTPSLNPPTPTPPTPQLTPDADPKDVGNEEMTEAPKADD